MDSHWYATREHQVSLFENHLPQKQVHGIRTLGTIGVTVRLSPLIINEAGEPTHPAESLDAHPWIRGNRGAILAHRSHPGQAPGTRDPGKGRGVVVPHFGLVPRV